MASPTQRSLAHARKLGMQAGVVEKWNQHAMIRQDLFGCFDLVIVEPPVTEAQALMGQRSSIVGVQACAGASHAARVSKVAAAAVLASWIATGARAEVWSWTKRGARGKRKLWALRVEVVTPAARESATPA